jgi:hypothetical protein
MRTTKKQLDFLLELARRLKSGEPYSFYIKQDKIKLKLSKCEKTAKFKGRDRFEYYFDGIFNKNLKEAIKLISYIHLTIGNEPIELMKQITRKELDKK